MREWYAWPHFWQIKDSVDDSGLAARWLRTAGFYYITARRYHELRHRKIPFFLKHHDLQPDPLNQHGQF